MTYEEAFQCLMDGLPQRGMRIISHRFDEQLFGNFVITFSLEGWTHTLVNDRGHLVEEARLWFRKRGRVVIDDLGDVSCTELMIALTPPDRPDRSVW